MSDGERTQPRLAMKRAGAATIAQSEDSCVVFGMPKAAIALGAVDRVLPIEAIGPAMAEGIANPRTSQGEDRWNDIAS